MRLPGIYSIQHLLLFKKRIIFVSFRMIRTRVNANDIARVENGFVFSFICVRYYTQFAVETLNLGKLHDHVTTDCVLLEGRFLQQL